MIVFPATIKQIVTGAHRLKSDSATPIHAVGLHSASATVDRAATAVTSLAPGFVGSPANITASLSSDAAACEFGAAPWSAGVLPTTPGPVDGVLTFFNTGDNATALPITITDMAATPNGTSNYRYALPDDLFLKLLPATANIFPSTYGALLSGAASLGGATLYARCLSAAPAFTESLVSDFSTIIGPRAEVTGWSIGDNADLSMTFPHPANFAGPWSGTVVYHLICIDLGGAGDLPLAGLSCSPAVVVSGGSYDLEFPANAIKLCQAPA